MDRKESCHGGCGPQTISRYFSQHTKIFPSVMSLDKDFNQHRYLYR